MQYESTRSLAQAIAAMAKNAVVQSARAIRRRIMDSMVFAPGPSAPGTPPHSHRGKLRGATRYAIAEDGRSAVIGTTYEDLPEAYIGKIHDKGFTINGKTWPARPYTRPALDAETPEFVGRFIGSI